MIKYKCVRELIFRLFRDVSLGCFCSNSLIASATTTSKNLTPAPRGCKIACKRGLFFSTTARRVTSPTWGPPPPRKQALSNQIMEIKRFNVKNKRSVTMILLHSSLETAGAVVACFLAFSRASSSLLTFV